MCARYKRLRLYCALKKIINPLLITPIFLSIKYTYKYTQAYMRAYIIDQISSYLQKKKKMQPNVHVCRIIIVEKGRAFIGRLRLNFQVQGLVIVWLHVISWSTRFC